MNMKTSLIRLPDWAINKIKEIAEEKSLRFATVVRCMVIDHLKEDVSGKERVQVVIHLHRGVIFNTAVFKNVDKAKKYRDEQVIDQYGKLVETQEGDDTIDLQECQVIT